MPILDMPLDELKTYQGSSPRPVDFDAFWDKSLEEMQALDPQIELRDAEFQVSFAECKHLFFQFLSGL